MPWPGEIKVNSLTVFYPMQPVDLSAITTDPLRLPLFTGKKIAVYMLRLDKIHPLISGNKWFKLRYYLEEAKTTGKERIVTFGGAWSNHIIATAAACRLENLKCTGIIRGEQPAVLSDTLKQAIKLGMELVFLSREDFGKGKIPGALLTPSSLIIQQGGFGEPGIRGAAEITGYAGHQNNYTHTCCAVGTGTMLAGLCIAAAPGQQVVGISVMKNNHQPEEDIQQFGGPGKATLRVRHEYHFGGYAKHQPSLLQFMNDWYRQTGIPTDFVYTGKLCYAVHDLVQKNYFPEGSRLLIIHSGGLTGNASLKKGTLIF